jgi:hypothetical protein
MRKMLRLFVDHPKTVGETYFQHLRQASSFSFHMITGGVACFLHGLLPFMFERTGSDQIRTLHDRMVVNRKVRSDIKFDANELPRNQA